MAKAGRKRKAGKRQPNGQPSRAGCGDAMKAVALAQPHRRGLGAAALDQRAESALGRLCLAGRISQAECEAGEMLRRCKVAFMGHLARPVRLSDFVTGADRMAIGCAGPGAARSAAGQMVAPSLGSDDADGSSDAPESDDERRERVLRRWSQAERVLWLALGYQREAFSTVLCVACDDRPLPSEAHLGWLRLGLKALAGHWRLTDGDAGAAAGTPGLRPMRAETSGKAVWGHEAKEIAVIYRTGT